MRLGATLGLVAAVLAMVATSTPTLAVSITIYGGQLSGSGGSTSVDLNSDSRFSQATDIAISKPWRLDDAYLDGASLDGEAGSDSEVELENFQVFMAAVVAANAKRVISTIERGNNAILGQTGLFQPAGAVPDRGSTLALFGFALGSFAFFGLRHTRRQPARANS
jgi:hypothetical protein